MFTPIIEYGADQGGEKKTPRRKGIGGRVDNRLVLQEWVQASGAWRRNRGESVTFEIEIDYCIRIGPGGEGPGE